MNLHDFTCDPVLTNYRVNYLFGLPESKKFIRSIQMNLTEKGFVFKKRRFTLYINYNKVKSFKLVKGAGSFWGTNLISDYLMAKLFEITYFDDYNKQICVRFEMYNSGVMGIKNAKACEELLLFITNNGISDKFIPDKQVDLFNDVFSQIEKLAVLHNSGTLTDEEFKNKKEELLKRI